VTRYVALGSSFASGPGVEPVLDAGCARSGANHPAAAGRRPAGPWQGGAVTVTPPPLEHVLHLEVTVDRPVEIGPTPAGHRRVIPITGGTVSGPLLTGRVLPGGADFQVIRTETETVAEARYVIETDQGERVYVENTGLRTGSAEDIARLRQDLPVDPARIYFRSTPRFETSAPRLAVLTSHVFVGSGVRHPAGVVFDFFRVV
jgi:hypothetical protein